MIKVYKEGACPNEISKLLKDEGHMVNNSKTMNSTEALAMVSDDNLKVEQVRTKYRNLKSRTGGRIMCNEDSIRQVVLDLYIIYFTALNLTCIE